MSLLSVILPNDNVDTTTLTVKVQNSATNLNVKHIVNQKQSLVLSQLQKYIILKKEQMDTIK